MTDDDFTVIWRGLSIGRIMQASGRPPRAMVMELLRHQQARSQRQRHRPRRLQGEVQGRMGSDTRRAERG